MWAATQPSDDCLCGGVVRSRAGSRCDTGGGGVVLGALLLNVMTAFISLLPDPGCPRIAGLFPASP